MDNQTKIREQIARYAYGKTKTVEEAKEYLELFLNDVDICLEQVNRHDYQNYDFRLSRIENGYKIFDSRNGLVVGELTDNLFYIPKCKPIDIGMDTEFHIHLNSHKLKWFESRQLTPSEVSILIGCYSLPESEA